MCSGNAPQFRSRNPKAVVLIECSKGYIWTIELNSHIGKSIEYKFIIIGQCGQVLWRLVLNLAFKTSRSMTLVVFCIEWEFNENIIFKA